VRHELSAAERVCSHDGATLVEIGVEASEQLSIIPQQVRVIRHERVKYACPCCDGGPRLAGKPAQIIPKGLFSESALAWIATSKFDDGLPLYRQAALLRRFGGTDLSHNTMAANIVRVGAAVQPVINLLRDHLLDSPLVFGDETTVQGLKEPGRAAQAKSYMWVQMTQDWGPGGGGGGTADPAVWLRALAQHHGGGAVVRRAARGQRVDDGWLGGVRQDRGRPKTNSLGMLGTCQALPGGCTSGAARECAHARSAGPTVHRTDREAVRGGGQCARAADGWAPAPESHPGCWPRSGCRHSFAVSPR
jgi:transposase